MKKKNDAGPTADPADPADFDLDQFQAWAVGKLSARFQETYHEDIEKARLVTALGLAGELLELRRLKDHKIKNYYGLSVPEIGDLCWYAAILAYFYEIEMDDDFWGRVIEFGEANGAALEYGQHRLWRLSSICGTIIENVKKHVWQGHDMDALGLTAHLAEVFALAGLLAESYQRSMTLVLISLTAKLDERYPEGFDAERSRNRAE